MGGLEMLDPRYVELHDRAMAVLGADPRVASVAVGGSISEGTADAWSDLDLQVVVPDEHHDAFLADWPNWLAEITPTVFARTPILPFIINTVTADGLTFDLVVYRDEVFTFSPATGYTVGLLSGTRYDRVDDALEYAVVEQLRGLAGPFITMVQRGEYLKLMAGMPHVLGLLTTVFLAELDAPMPGKQWNTTFTEEQLAVVASLPGARATRASMLEFGLGLAYLVLTRARPLFVERGIPWPGGLAAVTGGRLLTSLGVDTSAWLH
jgi:hypothetical protein